MTNKVKKLLALLALACMVVFVVAVIVLMVQRTLAENLAWVITPMSLFLLFGLTSILINYLQERAAAKAEKENEQK
ncbi:MAG: hypothetical protein Q4C54_06895 [Clostridia bacterium]|nr:hypothetical protein [Clostridia bacterium]